VKAILAIDQGTTSTRAIIFSTSGNKIFSSQLEFKQYFPKNGWVEHNPNEIWNTTLKVIKNVIINKADLTVRFIFLRVTMAEEPTKLDISDEMIAERRNGSEKMPDDMPKWMASLITKIDLFSKWVGNIVCWITIPLIFAMVFEVLARKLFTAPTMWAYDMSRFLYGALFMLGAGYALSKGVHIRADFLYRNFKVKTQGLIDFWLYILFYFPGLLVFLYMTIGFVQESIMRGEKGMDTSWMPYMWPIKSCLLIGIIFLLIQGISELFKSYWAATRGKWPGDNK